jgi:hypothetical protein
MSWILAISLQVYTRISTGEETGAFSLSEMRDAFFPPDGAPPEVPDPRNALGRKGRQRTDE